eukprot:360766-Chlamydomonas_euryale.AAC.11
MNHGRMGWRISTELGSSTGLVQGCKAHKYSSSYKLPKDKRSPIDLGCSLSHVRSMDMEGSFGLRCTAGLAGSMKLGVYAGLGIP